MRKDTDELVDDGRLRVDNLDYMMSKGRRAFSWLRIDANNNCNLKCTYCRVPRSSEQVEEEELLTFLRTKVVSVRHLQFGCGMEPTLDSRLSDLMMKSSRTPARPAEQFVVQTNGTLLHHHDHLKMRKAGLNRLSVSIDSLDAEVHSNQRGGSDVNQIVNNLEQFRRNCPDVEIQFICVVTSANIDSTLELAHFARDLGVRRMSFRQVVYVPNHPNTVNEEVEPLIVSKDRFDLMRDHIQTELGSSLEMSFYDNGDLARHRVNMRQDSYYEASADKPFLAPMMKTFPETDLIKGKRFFVLRGFMKSGTNWICRLLNLHPNISCAGEFHWQTVTTPLIKIMDNSNLVQQKDGLRHAMWMRMDRMIKECMVLANHPDAIWIGDRTPSHITPSVVMDARIINLVRDGRDVLISRAYHFFNNPGLFPKYEEMSINQRRLRAFRKDSQFFKKNPKELLVCDEFVQESAYYWNEAINVNRQNTQDLEKGRVLDIRYEDTHRDVEKSRSEMYEFLESDPELAGPLGFNTRPGFEKEMPNRFLRKGVVGDWKNYFSQHFAKIFDDVAGSTLVDLGYVDSGNWVNDVPSKTD